jgi:hypothetical protein
LTVNQATTSSTSTSVCTSDLPYSWNGLTFAAAGTQTAHITNSAGCDSAATLVLTVKTATSSSSSLSICQYNLPYSWNGLTFTTAGTQTAHLTNSAGCDSAATLVLTVRPKPSPVIAQLGLDTLQTTTTFANYQWLYNNTPLAGDTNRVLVVTQNGNYRVLVYDANGCLDTSAVFNVQHVGVNDIAGNESIKLYPNPNNGSFILETSGAVRAEFTVVDMLGRIVKEDMILSDKQSVNMSDISAGVYYLQIKGAQFKSPIAFTINK